MSETDDTDDLLLIPPDLFVNDVIGTYEAEPYFGIVDELINKVDRLQDRINYMEISGSLIEITSEDEIMDNRKLNGSDDLLNDRYINSTLSTPQKPRVKYKMNSLPATPTSPLRPLPRTKVPNENKQKLKPTRTKLQFENKCDCIEVSGRVINMKDIEVMMDEIQFQRSETEKRLQDRENMQRITQNITRKTNWPPGDDDNSLPDYSYGGNRINRLTVTKLDSPSSQSINTDQAERSESSSGSTQVTARLNPQSDKNYCTEDDCTLNGTSGSGLLSLKYLWGQNRDNKSLQEKLEEEKLRRLHCEQLIQELQSKNLELQEKIAVALDVDQAKDGLILKLHDAVEQLKGSNKTLSNEREYLEKDIKSMQEKHHRESVEVSNKLLNQEEEASKALDLARRSEEKLIDMEKENVELKNTLKHLEKDFQEAIAKQRQVCEKNRQMNEIIVQKELELKENKNILLESKNEVANSKKAIEACQSELVKMKSDYAQLEELLNDKQNQIKDLQTQKRSIMNDSEQLQQLYKKVEDDLKNALASFENEKSDLRNYYQGQVELVVREKLKEFQQQLDKAENSLQDEIKNKELSIARTAASHIQQLSEKHAIEVSLLEEKHREEVRFNRLQLQQSYQKIDQLQLKMKSINERRSNIAEQLHKVMEAQWLEALKIINNGKSPSSVAQDITLDQLNRLKNISHSNVEEVLSDKTDDDPKKVKGNFPLSSNNSGQLTYRLEETPLTSRPHHKSRAQHENEIQKYVQLLLGKQVDGNKQSNGKSDLNGDSSSWQDSNTSGQNSRRKK